MHRTKMDRLALVPLNEVLPRVCITERKKDVPRQKVRGVPVYLSSLRLQVFVTSGLRCVECGIEGRYFAIERSGNRGPYHLNLYALTEGGDEVLMTKDHIFPRSKGGKDELENLQTMCVCCNARKADRLDAVAVTDDSIMGNEAQART